MAIGAQYPQVGKSIVRAVPADVVKLQRNRLPVPLSQTTAGAAPGQHPLAQESPSKRVRRHE